MTSFLARWRRAFLLRLKGRREYLFVVSYRDGGRRIYRRTNHVGVLTREEHAHVHGVLDNRFPPEKMSHAESYFFSTWTAFVNDGLDRHNFKQLLAALSKEWELSLELPFPE